MSPDRTPALLHDLVHHAGRIDAIYRRFGKRDAFLEDETAKDAVLWNLVVIGESCHRLGEQFHERHPEIPWKAIIAHRNVIAHGYDVLNWDRIVLVIERDLPTLMKQAGRLLGEYGPAPED